MGFFVIENGEIQASNNWLIHLDIYIVIRYDLTVDEYDYCVL